MKHVLNLALALLALPAMLAVAGGEGEQSTEASSDMMSDSQYKEAPMLAERVAAGELPPVDERLPDVPDVIEPTAEVGTYGGTIQLISNLPEFTPRPSSFPGWRSPGTPPKTARASRSTSGPA